MVKRECAKRGISLQSLLKSAGVSSNAYYSLAGKPSAIPVSIARIADALGVSPTKLMVDEQSLLEKHLALISEVDRISELHPEIERDAIRHTLLSLDEPPIDRLRRALTLGRIRHTN